MVSGLCLSVCLSLGLLCDEIAAKAVDKHIFVALWISVIKSLFAVKYILASIYQAVRRLTAKSHEAWKPKGWML